MVLAVFAEDEVEEGRREEGGKWEGRTNCATSADAKESKASEGNREGCDVGGDIADDHHGGGVGGDEFGGHCEGYGFNGLI